MRYPFIEREKAHYAVATRCRVLCVSSSGYYAWRRRPPSARAPADQALTTRITTTHGQRRQTYGAPCIQAELADHGIHCGRKRVARLMRAAGIVGGHRRRR